MTELPEAELVIGTVAGPFGIRGEVKVRLHTDYPQRYYDLDEVGLRGPEGAFKRLKIEGVRLHKNMALVKFQGCDDIDTAETLRGFDLVIPESQSVKLAENEFFLHDIMGLRVHTTEGRDLGEITQVIRGPANDAYVTPEAIIPALKSVVVQVDLVGRKMVVKLPDGEAE